MSHMEEVAKMLGVEIGEEFDIYSQSGTIVLKSLFFDDDGLYCESGKKYGDLLQDLLAGVYDVVKRPWRPKEGERYYCIEINGIIDAPIWLSWSEDIMAYSFGNCFRTKEDAKIYADKVVAKMNKVLEG